MAPQNIGSGPATGQSRAAPGRSASGATVRAIIPRLEGAHRLRTDTNLIRVGSDMSESVLREVSRALHATPPGASALPWIPGEPLFLWEMRARTRRGEPEAVSVDGGARVEKRIRGSNDVTGYRFAVGAGPGALRELARGNPPSLGCSADAWRRLAQHVVSATSESWRRLRRELSAVARSSQALSSGRAALETEATLRLRGCAGPGTEPIVEIARGVRLLLRAKEGRARGRVLYEWSGTAPERGRLLEDEVADSLAGTSWPVPRRDEPPAPSLQDGYRGPAVLLKDAAAWWVHEMAHAAFERELPSGRAATGRSGWRIIDDPAAGAWPFGFSIDDAGAKASRTVLWGDGSEGSVPDSGHRRRSSVRDDARPAPSVTHLSCGNGTPLSFDGIPAGWPVAVSVTGGRFDPLNRQILLSVERLGVTNGSGWSETPLSAVVTVRAEDGWESVEQVAEERPSFDVHATCTRDGRSNPVMVGAPTVALNPVRLLLS